MIICIKSKSCIKTEPVVYNNINNCNNVKSKNDIKKSLINLKTMTKTKKKIKNDIGKFNDLCSNTFNQHIQLKLDLFIVKMHFYDTFCQNMTV